MKSGLLALVIIAGGYFMGKLALEFASMIIDKLKTENDDENRR
tara:strand:- start:55 stop:183 length:129 start_codon:yes stop_codon:yes gene_type:complete